MNHSNEIKALADAMVKELYTDNNYSAEDLMNALVIAKPILISLVIKNARNLGTTKEEVLQNFRNLMLLYKQTIETIVGFELTTDIYSQEDYGILEEGVLE